MRVVCEDARACPFMKEQWGVETPVIGADSEEADDGRRVGGLVEMME